ncbi:MAG: elongation factor Ts [bacterium]
MAITSEQIKKIRDLTNVSVMQCKRALEEAGGDEAKALLLLSKKGTEIAQKKAERTLGAGVVVSYVHSSGTAGSLIELNSESDFVAKNEGFKALAYDIAMHIVAMKPEYLKPEDVPADAVAKVEKMFAEEVEKANKPEEIKKKMLEGKISSYFGERTLLKQAYIKNPDQTIEDLIKAHIQKFGEKIEVARFTRFSVLDK